MDRRYAHVLVLGRARFGNLGRPALDSVATSGGDLCWVVRGEHGLDLAFAAAVSMSELEGSPWWVIAAAALPSVASGLWVFWRWWVERGDKIGESARAREQVLFRDLEAQRAALSREQAELFDRLRKELTRTQLRLAELEQDRDRGWDLARWWNQRAHELRHAGLNAQAMVAGFCSREGVDVPNWPGMDLPGLEETK